MLQGVNATLDAGDTRLEGFRKTYDFAVLDCSPSLGALTMNAIRAADVVLVRPGARVSADGEIIEAVGVENRLDQAQQQMFR